MQEQIRKRWHGPEPGPCVYSQVRRLTRKLLSLCNTFFSLEDITTARSFLPRCSSFSFWLGRQPPSRVMRRREQKLPFHMKKSLCINTGYYLQPFLIVSAICLLGFTGCSSAGASAAKGLHAAPIAKTYNGEQQ